MKRIVCGVATLVFLSSGATFCLATGNGDSIKASSSTKVTPLTTWASSSDVANSKLPLEEQLGSNPGGSLTRRDGSRCYVKYPAPNTPENRNKLWGEALACKLYDDAGVEVPKTTLVLAPGIKQIRLESDLVDGWQKLEGHPEILQTLLSSKSEVNIKNIEGLYENFVVDAWLNAWDVVGLTYDNIGYVKDKERYRFVRIDTGGAFDFRAMSNGTKTKAYGPEVFSNQVASVKTMLEVPRNQEVFARMQLHHFYEGVQKLEKYADTNLYHWVVDSGIGDKTQRIDLFMKMLERKKNLVRYATWLQKKKCPLTQSFIEIVQDPVVGFDVFCASNATSTIEMDC